MRKVFKALVSQIRADAALLRNRPFPHFDAKANANYWAVRRADKVAAPNSFQKDRASWIAARIKQTPATLLDIGSGTGEMLQVLADRRSNLKIVASDFEPTSQAHLKQLGFEVMEVDISESSSIHELRGFDYITICEVLEHTQNPEDSLLALKARARYALFFSVPNTGYYIYRLRLLLGRFPVQWRAHPGEHVRYWTLSDMKWWLERLGLSQQSTIEPYQGWPLLNKLWPAAFAMGLIVEVRCQ